MFALCSPGRKSLTACYICYHIKFRKKRKLKVLATERRLIIQITHMVCILTTLATYKFFWSKITASCGVMCVTLIRLPFKHEKCDQYHLLFS